MAEDKKLEEQFNDLQELSKQNPNIDVASAMIGALEQEHANRVQAKNRHLAYLISIGLPPLGIGFAIYYYFFTSASDRKKTAYWCVGLTVFSLLIAYITFQVIINVAVQTTGQSINLNQLQQEPAQLQQILQQ